MAMLSGWPILCQKSFSEVYTFFALMVKYIAKPFTTMLLLILLSHVISPRHLGVAAACPPVWTRLRRPRNRWRQTTRPPVSGSTVYSQNLTPYSRYSPFCSIVIL